MPSTYESCHLGDCESSPGTSPIKKILIKVFDELKIEEMWFEVLSHTSIDL